MQVWNLAIPCKCESMYKPSSLWSRLPVSKARPLSQYKTILPSTGIPIIKIIKLGWSWDGPIFIMLIVLLIRRHLNIATAASRWLREPNYSWVCALPGFLKHPPTSDHWIGNCQHNYLRLWCHVYPYQNYKMVMWIYPKYHAWITTCATFC